jgi:hypothetical protein
MVSPVAPAAPPRGRLGRLGRWSWETWVFAAALVCGAGLILYAGRRLGFYYDEWQYIQFRRGGDLSTYLEPHNGHLSVIPVAIYKLLFATVGLDHYWPYRLVLLAFHLTSCVLAFTLVRRRLGDRAALIVGLLLVIMATSAENLVWAFQLDFMGSVASGVGAFLLLDRPSRRNDRWVCVLLAVSLGCSSLGVPFLLGVAVELALQPQRRRQLWIVAIPGALFGLWLLKYGTSGQIQRENLAATTQYVADAASAAAACIVGLPAWGQTLLVGGAAGVAILRRGDAVAPPPSPRLAGYAVTILTFWTLTALSRAQLHEPGAPRYLYIGALMLMLIAVWLLPRPRAWSPWATATVAVLLAFVLLGNGYRLRDAERFFRGIWEPLRASLAAYEVAGSAADPSSAPIVPAWPNLTAGPYLAAVRDNGSPTGGVRWLLRASESQRQVADRQLVAAEGVGVRPVASAPVRTGSQPVVEAAEGARLARSARCVAFSPQTRAGALTLRVRPGEALAIRAASGGGVALTTRRFAEQFTGDAGTVSGGKSALLRIPADRAPAIAWHVRIASAQPLRVCGAGA